jgi:hypothetical protein
MKSLTVAAMISLRMLKSLAGTLVAKRHRNGRLAIPLHEKFDLRG